MSEPIVTLNEKAIKDELKELVRQTVEDTINAFPDGHAALMLVTTRLRYVADSEWGSRRYLDVSLLEG